MTTFYCSVIIPPSRWVNRERVIACSNKSAYALFKAKYASLCSRYSDSLILVEDSHMYAYWNPRNDDIIY